MKELKPRSPLYAILLSAHVPGLGQMYNGELAMGVLMILGFTAALAGLFELGIFHGFHGVLWELLAITLFYGYQVAEAGFGAHKRYDYILKKYNHWGFYTVYSILIVVFGVFVCVPLAEHHNPFEIHKVASNSMIPTLFEGDHLLVDAKAFEKQAPQRWSPVIFECPKSKHKICVKRIIGLPGEALEIKQKALIINGKGMLDVQGRYNLASRTRSKGGSKDSFGPVSIPEGRFFVMGDNRNNSRDSRHYGMVDESVIYGKPLMVLFSWDGTRIGVPVQ